MRKLALILILVLAARASAQQPVRTDIARWQHRAQNVTIIRDDWGVPHIHAKTDADAIFGSIYAQAEDDFNRVETNYLNSMGRNAEAEGASRIYEDLRMKLFIDPDSMKALYTRAPASMKALMNGWADGLNYFLYTHPQVKPKVIKRFESWMPLTFSEGSIGGDIESVDIADLEKFYGGTHTIPTVGRAPTDEAPREPGGSNGFAIAPSNTLNHHALLLINPHTSFFFRAEQQITSDEGLNVYGAMTWGQFFVYQGFNEHAGWMHTSSAVDNIDEYLETVVRKGNRLYYRYGAGLRPLVVRTVTVPYKTDQGMAKKVFTIYRTQHGPIVREQDGRWVSTALMEEPLQALTQSFMRTKVRGYDEFRKILDMHTNSSNNTIFADASGNIAYFHSNFIPRRNPRFDWTKPVDGTDTATSWHGVLSFAETPNLLNPATGWLYNSNDWPWAAAGPNSPKQSDFPRYVDSGTESPRGRHAVMVLQNKKDFTLASLVAAAYDTYLPGFEEWLPPLLKAYDDAPANDPLKAKLAEPIATLRAWDYRWSVGSIATSLGAFYYNQLHPPDGSQPQQLMTALSDAVDKLTADFGTWRTPWGEINRFQRLTGDIVQPFSDAGPSIPVGFPSANLGSLASFGARPYSGTKKWYGTNGNSFVAVVEFGDSVRAMAVTAGGESGHPENAHFNDQANRYSTGALRPVYFYPSQLAGHVERTYHPGN